MTHNRSQKPKSRAKRRDGQALLVRGGTLRYPRLRDLIALVHMLQGSGAGISLAEIQERFQVSRRTAERMRDATLDSFPQIEELRLDDGTKRWRLRDRLLAPAAGVASDDLAALQTIGKLLRRGAHRDLEQSLVRIGDAVRAAMRWNELVRTEPDVEALTEAEGLSSRAGPREKVKLEVLAALREAIKRSVAVRLTHWTANATRPSRGHVVAPLGLLHAEGRRYLVGRSGYHGAIHLFRLGRIDAVDLTSRPVARPRDFDIDRYAAQAFGVFQEEPVDVVWRFKPEAAADARTFLFHPTQTLQDQADGALLVSFKSGGLREMCWHLFTWGEAVEIVKPKKLKVLYRRLLAEAQRGTDR